MRHDAIRLVIFRHDNEERVIVGDGGLDAGDVDDLDRSSFFLIMMSMEAADLLEVLRAAPEWQWSVFGPS
jgi:hypothetical protein